MAERRHPNIVNVDEIDPMKQAKGGFENARRRIGFEAGGLAQHIVGLAVMPAAIADGDDAGADDGEDVALYENGGSFVDAISISLQHPDSSATLRYTLDDTLPTTNSMPFTEPFTLTNSATLRVKAFEVGFNDSVAATVSFLIRPPVFFEPGGYFNNGQFQLQLSGLAGKSYWFQASTNLLDWFSLSTNTAPSNLLDLVDPAASNFPYRFYRALEQP